MGGRWCGGVRAEVGRVRTVTGMTEFLVRTRLTQRDLRVARWVAEQQAVRLDTIAQLLAQWGAASQPRNLRRLAERWEHAGLIKRGRILAEAPTILWPTSAAMRLTDLDDKRAEKLPSISTLHHTLAVARVRLEYEKHGLIFYKGIRIVEEYA